MHAEAATAVGFPASVPTTTAAFSSLDPAPLRALLANRESASLGELYWRASQWQRAQHQHEHQHHDGCGCPADH